MNEFNLAATTIGYLVMAVVALGLLAITALLAWRYFPVRWNFARRTPSLLKTPNGVFALDLLVGFSSRGKTKWFVGLMHLSPGQEPEIKARK